MLYEMDVRADEETLYCMDLMIMSCISCISLAGFLCLFLVAVSLKVQHRTGVCCGLHIPWIGKDWDCFGIRS